MKLKKMFAPSFWKQNRKMLLASDEPLLDSDVLVLIFDARDMKEFAGKIWQECLASSDATTLDVTFYDWWQEFMKRVEE